MIVDVDEVLTPEEFSIFEAVAKKAIAMADALGRSDKVRSITTLLNKTRSETCQVYPTR